MRKDRSTPWYQRTPIVILVSLLSSLIGFASIATLLGVSVTDELNKDYYSSADEPLFKKGKQR